MAGIVQLARLLAFLVFLALGLRVAGTAEGPARRRAVNTLLGYVLLVNALFLLHGMVRLADLDGWPFTTHTIATMRADVRRRLCLHDFRALDASGWEWSIDPLAWSPVHVSIVQTWVNFYFPRLAEPQRRSVLAFLLERAERSRARLAAGEPIGREARLGRLSAPYWWMLPRATAVPAGPYVGLRVYRVCWVPAEWLADRTRLSRTLVAEQRDR